MLFSVPVKSAGRRPSFLSLTLHLPSAVACPAQTKFQRVGLDFDILDVPSGMVGAIFQCVHCCGH